MLSPESIRSRNTPKNSNNDNTPITVRKFINHNPEKLNDSKLNATKRKNQSKNLIGKKDKDKLIVRLKGLVELVSST